MSIIVDNIESTEELSEGVGRTRCLPLNITRKKWVLVKDEKEILCGAQRHYHFEPFDKIGDKEIKKFRTKKEAISYLKNHTFRFTRYEDNLEITDDYIKYFDDIYVAVQVTEVIK